MKKSTKRVIIVVVAVLIFMALVVGGIIGLISLLNKEKDSITADQFKEIMEQKSYEIVDAKYQVSQYNFVDQVYLAMDGSYSYQLEFYQMSDEAMATSFYNTCVANFDNTKGSSSMNSSISGKNYSKYTLEANGKYSVVSKINNTILYVNVDSQYKDTVKDIIDEIGY